MLGIYGPNAIEAFDHIVPLGIAQMEPQSVKNLSIFMMTITVLRGGWLGVDGIEIFGGANGLQIGGRRYRKIS